MSAGSSCHNVFVWDVPSRRLLYKLPGHLGTVNEVAFHPTVGEAQVGEAQVVVGEALWGARTGLVLL